MIKVESLTKYYGDIVAVDNISFEIPQGQIVGFLGPNGAGKTTTMRILTGYLSATSGNATICGYSVSENPQEVQKRVGYLPEMNPLYEDITPTEYLEFVGSVRNFSYREIQNRIKEIVALCGLKDVLNQNIGELSRGYRQRVGFASAIFHNPDVLILDEPTSGLDPNQAREVRELIKELKKDKTVILSTHILSEVQAICDRVIIINRGKIVVDGTTSELQDMAKGKEKIYLEVKSKDEPLAIEEKLKGLPYCESVLFKEQKDNIKIFEIESGIDL
ncbi:MAG: ABC transporter ATP-binding protein, partial [Endomicrobiia bacterium]